MRIGVPAALRGVGQPQALAFNTLKRAPWYRPDDYAPYPAPEGYRWEFLTDSGVVVTDGGVPMVDLIEVSYA